MAEKGILFNTEMVRAILDGRKTQTRRPIKRRYDNTVLEMKTDKYGTRLIEIQKDEEGVTFGKHEDGSTWRKLRAYIEPKPAYKRGDILYVRETWFYESHMEDLTAGEPDLPSGRYKHRYVYYADQPDYPVNVGAGATGWRPSIHMPKEAARIWLKVTNVSVQRLKEITDEDAIAEGFGADETFKAHERFAMTWNSVYGFTKAVNGWRMSSPENWGSNPWVWVISFEQIEREAGK